MSADNYLPSRDFESLIKFRMDDEHISTATSREQVNLKYHSTKLSINNSLITVKYGKLSGEMFRSLSASASLRPNVG